MATKTDDLFVVSRGGVNYKATGSQLFDFEGGAKFGTTLEVTSDVSAGGDLDVTGEVTAGGDLDVTGEVTVAKQITATEGYALAQLPALP